MKVDRKHKIRYGILVTLLLTVSLCRASSAAGEYYATAVYPHLSYLLSGFSSLFPFSVGDLFLFLSVLWVVGYPFYAWRKKRHWKQTLLRVAEYLLWMYVWFYLAWGLNYFRKDFYARTSIEQVDYTPKIFHSFLKEYIANLNAAYIPIEKVDPVIVDKEVKEGYSKTGKTFGLADPKAHQRAKTMMFTPFISMIGISGYMGPFFSEFNLNGDLPPSQYPATYAHELAHLLGITSEAEANLYAYLVCVRANDEQIRFSGYFSLLPHVLRNARRLLSEEEFEQLVAAVRPEIRILHEANRIYWQNKYSPLVGDVQDVIYDWFLKGNNISSGMLNYSEVIGLLISHNENTK